MSAVDVLASVPSSKDIARARQLIESLTNEYNAAPLDKRADCAALCIGDLEGWLYIAENEGETRHSLTDVIRHCFWRFREDYMCEPFSSLPRPGGEA